MRWDSVCTLMEKRRRMKNTSCVFQFQQLNNASVWFLLEMWGGCVLDCKPLMCFNLSVSPIHTESFSCSSVWGPSPSFLNAVGDPLLIQLYNDRGDCKDYQGSTAEEKRTQKFNNAENANVPCFPRGCFCWLLLLHQLSRERHTETFFFNWKSGFQ